MLLVWILLFFLLDALVGINKRLDAIPFPFLVPLIRIIIALAGTSSIRSGTGQMLTEAIAVSGSNEEQLEHLEFLRTLFEGYARWSLIAIFALAGFYSIVLIICMLKSGPEGAGGLHSLCGVTMLVFFVLTVLFSLLTRSKIVDLPAQILKLYAFQNGFFYLPSLLKHLMMLRFRPEQRRAAS